VEVTRCAVLTPAALEQLGFLRAVLVEAAAAGGYAPFGGVSNAMD
jgi:hypothetical protein